MVWHDFLSIVKFYNKEQWQTRIRIHKKYSVQRGIQQSPKDTKFSLIRAQLIDYDIIIFY